MRSVVAVVTARWRRIRMWLTLEQLYTSPKMNILSIGWRHGATLGRQI
ncbi:MAG: hypothetical protein HS132_18160 [Planctomycetia bacterium]|nr:hypothetical protein [Planctomycetia bacterium]